MITADVIVAASLIFFAIGIVVFGFCIKILNPYPKLDEVKFIKLLGMAIVLLFLGFLCLPE